MWNIWKGLHYVTYTEPYGCKGFHLCDPFPCAFHPLFFFFVNGSSKYLCSIFVFNTTNYIMNFKLSSLNFQQLIVGFQTKAK